MKYLKILIQPIRIKGDLEDEDQLREDLYEKVISMCESETLAFTIDDDESEDEDDNL